LQEGLRGKEELLIERTGLDNVRQAHEPDSCDAHISPPGRIASRARLKLLELSGSILTTSLIYGSDGDDAMVKYRLSP